MTDLVAVAHGTADPRGIRVVHDLVREMARQRPDLAISLGFVDLLTPALPSLVRRITTDASDAVVVPLLLSSGYHVYVDVAAEAQRYPGQVHAADALGPDPVLVEILADRLGDLSHMDTVVLAAAGSSDPRALADCETTARLLSARVDRPVRVAYVSGAGDRLPDVLARTSGRLAVATYLLAPGFFHSLIQRHAAPHTVTAPLAPDPRLSTLALHRYEAARAASRLSADAWAIAG
ncbi:sirohydrochlorin chelatase [Kribbella sindirgiensis]|uniref:Sirohydrochlorin chelatase n=1 Tax=Kribbella sindirgiensis TaxID=1124744 RepID=A0A4R0IU81_9ACTN|nr:CbiX/SirB N-terminal domain-containing protein [Kribbella sindirgiensis]TCC34998.1 sirohydrochlorin chelatase [Kribbella sindirgiensis]